MNQKKAKRLRQLVRHMQDKGVVENKEWLAYGYDQKFVKMDIPDPDAEEVFDADGNIVMAKKNILVATGCRKMDPSSGRAIYKAMKERADLNHKQ